MKTRQEMIYDFMLALAPTFQKIQDDLTSGNRQIDISEVADIIYWEADSLATAYLESVA